MDSLLYMYTYTYIGTHTISIESIHIYICWYTNGCSCVTWKDRQVNRLPLHLCSVSTAHCPPIQVNYFLATKTPSV